MRLTCYWCAILWGSLWAAAVWAQDAPRLKKQRPGVASERVLTKTEPATRPGPAYLTGTAEVSLSGQQNPIIRLGLARHGATLVEFPATDFFYAVHPGSATLVTVEESPTLATDHYLVFRAGPDFVPPPTPAPRPLAPQAAVTVQMQSGLGVTFLFYPVADVAQMAHRCTVRYTRAEVVAARRAAGLVVNLAESETESLAPSARGTPSPVNRPESIAPPRATESPINQTLTASVPSAQPPTARPHKQPAPFTIAAQEALRAALAAPQQFTGWSRTTQGLALALLPPVELDERQRLLVVAVRNMTAQGRRLVAPPALDLATLDRRGQVVLAQPLPVVSQASTALGGAVPGGATIYYALVYAAPVLGVQQRLRVAVAHDAAADAPATTQLPQ